MRVHFLLNASIRVYESTLTVYTRAYVYMCRETENARSRLSSEFNAVRLQGRKTITVSTCDDLFSLRTILKRTNLIVRKSDILRPVVRLQSPSCRGSSDSDYLTIQ